MARKKVEKKIGEKTYTIKELTIENILQLFDGDLAKDGVITIGKNDGDESNLVGEINDIVKIINKAAQLTCEDFSMDDAKKMTPSEIKELWEAFQEVNSDFLEILKSLGVLEMLKEVILNIKETALSNFLKIAVT